MPYKDKNKQKEYYKEYYLKNKEKLKESSNIYYENNKEKVLTRLSDNSDKKVVYNREYNIKNKERIKIQREGYYKAYWDKNPSAKIAHRLRNRLCSVLRNYDKSTTLLNLLGCSIANLKNHLEAQFTDGMSWDNYGLRGWHIDHIRPCASFDLSDPEQQKECFHYTNLQPLWAKDNLSKHCKII